MGFALSTFNPLKLKSGEKYKQEFYFLRLFVNRALTYRAEGLIIDQGEKAIKFHIVSGHICLIEIGWPNTRKSDQADRR